MSEATTDDIRNMVRIVAEVYSNSLESPNDDFTRKLVANAVAGFDRWLDSVKAEAWDECGQECTETTTQIPKRTCGTITVRRQNEAV